MKMYYCEDRSAGNTGAAANPKVCNTLQLVELTDWSAEELDSITSLDISEEITTDGKLYVRRLV